MKLLLDPHALLWHADGSSQLSPTAAALLSDPANDLYISLATLREIVIKVGLRKLTLSCSYADYVARAISGYNLHVLSVTPDDCAAYATLPFPLRDHRDPFDRMIVIHALRYGTAIVGADSSFDAYGVTRLW